MRKFNVLLVGFVLLANSSQAQKITGVVKDHQGKPLEKSTVTLHRATDSSVIKLAVTGNEGKYSLLAEKGRYLLSASFVGYEPSYSNVFEVNGDMQVPEIVMNKQRGDMTAVTVTAQRPLVEVKADKTIVNVEASINAVGNDGLKLLHR